MIEVEEILEIDHIFEILNQLADTLPATKYINILDRLVGNEWFQFKELSFLNDKIKIKSILNANIKDKKKELKYLRGVLQYNKIPRRRYGIGSD